MGRLTEGYRSSNSNCPVSVGPRSHHGSGDEPAKMVRAEKEGATIGPTHGSRMEEASDIH